jgi:hypothetical protein
MKCHWCGEPLTFVRGRGWLHPDGRLYKTRLDYPLICYRCRGKLTDGYCRQCDIQYELQEVDDHCALPEPE